MSMESSWRHCGVLIESLCIQVRPQGQACSGECWMERNPDGVRESQGLGIIGTSGESWYGWSPSGAGSV